MDRQITSPQSTGRSLKTQNLSRSRCASKFRIISSIVLPDGGHEDRKAQSQSEQPQPWIRFTQIIFRATLDHSVSCPEPQLDPHKQPLSPQCEQSSAPLDLEHAHTWEFFPLRSGAVRQTHILSRSAAHSARSTRP